MNLLLTVGHFYLERTHFSRCPMLFAMFTHHPRVQSRSPHLSIVCPPIARYLTSIEMGEISHQMPIWYVLVPRHISTRRNILNSMMPRPMYPVQRISRPSGKDTCLYMLINKRPCTSLCVSNLHRNSLFDLTTLSIVTLTPDTRPDSPVHPIFCYHSFRDLSVSLLHVCCILCY